MKKFLLCLTLVGLVALALGGAAGAQPQAPRSLAHTLTSTNPGTLMPDWAALGDPISPTVSTIDPAAAPNDIDTFATITGAGFTDLDVTGTIVTPPTVSLGATPLTNVTWVDANTLTATVPWGMDAGPSPYTLTVVNPDGGSGSLTDAFTVTQGLGRWNGGDLYGGDVRQILLKPGDPTTVFAAPYGVNGLFRSQDAGEHWTYVSDDVGVGNGRFAIDPLHPAWIYAYGYSTYTEQSGLFRSTDEGDTWTRVMPNAWPDGQGVDFPQVYVSPHDPQVLFVSSAHEPDDPYPHGAAGLIKSTDGGATWTIVTDMAAISVQGVAFHPTDPLKMVLATTTGQVFQSTDVGDTWSEVTKPPLTSFGSFGVITYNPYRPIEVWIAATDTPQSASGAIYKSTDAAFTTWQDVTPADGSGSHSIAFTGADSVFIDRHQSIDGGSSWQPIGTMTSGGGFVFDPNDPQTGYVCDGVYGVQKTTDGGKDWQVKDQGLTGMVCRSMSVSQVDPLRVYAPFSGFGGFYQSNDGAASWTFKAIAGFYNEGQVYEAPGDSERLYSVAPQDLYGSADGGTIWSRLGWNMSPTPPSGSPHDMEPDPNLPGHLLVGWNSGPWSAGTGQLFSSSDYGVSWQEVTSVPPGMTSINSIAFDPMTSGLVYATTNASGVYRSIDGGASWTKSGDPQPADMQYAGSIAIATHPRHVVLIGTRSAPPFRSFDDGTTWERAKTAPGGGADYMFAGSDSSRLYFGDPRGLYLSTDAGDTWTRAAGEFGHLQVTALGWAPATDHTIIYAATAGGHTGTPSLAASAAPRGVAAASSSLVGAGVYRYVLVPTPKVTLKLSGLTRSALKLGRLVTARGVVTPSRLVGSKVKVAVQRKRVHTWITVKTVLRTIRVGGVYSWRYRPAKRGDFRLRVTIATTATHTAALTTWRAFKVK